MGIKQKVIDFIRKRAEDNFETYEYYIEFRIWLLLRIVTICCLLGSIYILAK